MNISYLNLESPHIEWQNELETAFRRVLKSGWYILGAFDDLQGM